MQKDTKISNDIKTWHGFKIVYTNHVKYVSPHKTERLILINPAFWDNANVMQRYYMLHWCRYAHKYKDLKKADEKAKKIYLKQGLDFKHILKLLEKMQHTSKDFKRKRIFNLITESTVTDKTKNTLNKINKCLKKIFQLRK